MTDWHQPTASFEASTLANIPAAPQQSTGRHRAVHDEPPAAEFSARGRRIVYGAALLGLALVVAVFMWAFSGSSTQQSAPVPLTPLGTVTPYPTTTLPEPASDPAPDVPVADATPVLLPRYVPAPRRLVTRTVRVPAPIVTSSTVPPVTTTVLPPVTVTPTSDSAPYRYQPWGPPPGWQERQQSGLLGIVGR